MLPFLNRNQIADNIIERRHKSLHAKPEIESPTNEPKDIKYETLAEDVLRAIQEKSVKDLANSLAEVFHYLEEQPHEEGPHIKEKE